MQSSVNSYWLVSWSLASSFSTNMAISETKGQGWRAIPTQWRKASDILTSTLAAFLFSSHPKGKGIERLIRSPVLWTVDLMFCACFFFSQLTFSDVWKPTFSKLFHMTWLYQKKKSCYTDFLKVPLTKWGCKNKFCPISRLIATYYAPSLIMWKENRKSKTIVFVSDY